MWAAAGTGFTFLMTALGASVVFIFRKEMGKNIQRAFLGFAAGVMIAASVWSLLIPAIDQTMENGGIAWVPAAGGFLLGAFFLMGLDFVMPHLPLGEKQAEGMPLGYGVVFLGGGGVRGLRGGGGSGCGGVRSWWGGCGI